MALAFSDTLRNNMLDEITAMIDAGTTGGYLRIYNGTRPAKGGTPTTLLAELQFSTTSFPAATSGSMSANSITQDSSANAAGTATWFRIVDDTGTFVLDGDVASSASDLNLNPNNVISLGQVVTVSSFTLTAGNA